jgi:outer membrane protein OmpA-like peptidoglycan-associated protein
VRVIAAFALVGAVLAGCAQQPSGPAFVPAPEAHRALPSVAPDPLPPLSKFVTLANGSEVATVSSDYLFELNSDELRPEAVTALERILPQIKEHAGRISITGFTDGLGATDYNQALSLRRADAVRSWLAGQGIPESVMTTKGGGETGAPADIANAASRRVEIALQ